MDGCDCGIEEGVKGWMERFLLVHSRPGWGMLISGGGGYVVVIGHCAGPMADLFPLHRRRSAHSVLPGIPQYQHQYQHQEHPPGGQSEEDDSGTMCLQDELVKSRGGRHSTSEGGWTGCLSRMCAQQCAVFLV